MLRHLRWVAGCLVLPVALIAGPAQAEVAAARDPRSDVLRYDGSGDRSPTTVDRDDTDLVGYRLDHGTERFSAVLRYRDLSRRAPVLWAGIPISYRRPTGVRHLELEVLATRDDRTGTARLSGGAGHCAVSHRIRYDLDRIRLSVPTRCLEHTPWLRASAATYTTDGLDDPRYVFVDTAPDNPRGGPGLRLQRG